MIECPFQYIKKVTVCKKRNGANKNDSIQKIVVFESYWSAHLNRIQNILIWKKIYFTFIPKCSKLLDDFFKTSTMNLLTETLIHELIYFEDKGRKVFKTVTNQPGVSTITPS